MFRIEADYGRHAMGYRQAGKNAAARRKAKAFADRLVRDPKGPKKACVQTITERKLGTVFYCAHRKRKARR